MEERREKTTESREKVAKQEGREGWTLGKGTGKGEGVGLQPEAEVCKGAGSSSLRV
jgi:hypothetical protein